jgi:hypothetical protein
VKWYLVGIGVLMVLLTVVSLWRGAPERVIEDDTGFVSFVSGTEYNIGEAGQVIAEVRRQDGSQVLTTNCSFLVWYPNKTQFLQQGGVVAPSGNWYVNFTVPPVTGVYEYQANCTWPGHSSVASKSFHVSEFQNETLTKLRRIRAEIVK